MTNIVLLPLPLRFRAVKTLLLSLRFRTNNTKTLCCRYVALTLSRKRHLLARDPAAKRMFSVATANVYLCENKATATTKRLIGRPQEAFALCEGVVVT
ncbi:hypothetical protein [Lysinibacillus sphaericus]|uniref:hypothetical protein n=1 Tax=Lysinibacillus sphaericus TaxID=1421 RepID=UPI0018CDB9E0|nr:hypothetical protein [Lysinibacillus sphaericus]